MDAIEINLTLPNNSLSSLYNTLKKFQAKIRGNKYESKIILKQSKHFGKEKFYLPYQRGGERDQ